MPGGHQHRSGGLKQSNKKHKSRGRLATKRSIKRQEGGKVSTAGAGGAAHRPGNKQATVERDIRSERLNKARQLKGKKRDELYLQRRTGSSEGPPLVVALVGLSTVSDTAAVQEAYLKSAGLVAPAPPTHTPGASQASGVTAAFQTSKQRFTFLLPGFSLTAALEAARVADVIMFVVNVAHGEEACVSEEGDSILSGIRAQGLPGVVGIIQGLDSISSHKAQADLRRYGHRFFETAFGEKAKVADANNSVQLMRALSTAPSAMIHWRANRSYVLADDVKWEAQTDNPEVGTLRLRGYVRGRPLSVNQLLHVPNMGTFRMRVITKVGTEPCSLKNRPKFSAGMAVETHEEEEVVLVEADPKLQEELETLAEPDHMMGEQTWPTEEEEEAARMDGAWEDDADDEEGPEKGDGKKKKKRLLKKMSEYQASWFVGEEGVDDEEHGDGDDAAAPEEDDDDDDASDDGMMTEDLGTASVMSKKPKRELSDGEKQELEFPDEVDTPQDIPARTRFARYRALKSFRTSPWDPKESLPRDYARIFQFQNFPRACARVAAEHDEVEQLQNQAVLSSKRVNRGGGSCAASVVSMDVAGEEGTAKGSTTESAEQAVAAQYQGYVASGVYVTVHVDDVPLQAYQNGLQASAGPLMAFSLLRYENKISVLHFNIQKHMGAADVSINSKDRLVFHTGFRTFEGRPVFSDNNLNCDKHKFMRFLHAGRFAVASVYGPVTMPPCPLLMFKETRDEQGVLEGRQLIATGTLATVDPNRIVLKRIVLTGYPVRAKKRSAVVKHMFYNPDDVRWFKPAELSTKLGAMGHIREPVGTHGLMKVRFNRVINQSDTVCLPLYKRVYPKFLEDTPEAGQ